MAKITLIYPETGLSVSISVKNRDTGSEDFTGTMTEVGGVYKYDFTEVADTDYIYTASVAGYDDMKGVIYRSVAVDSTVIADAVRVELTPELDKVNTNLDAKVSTVGGGGGGYGFSSDTIQRAITNAKKEILEKTDEVKEEIKEEIVRNKPKDIDFTEIIDKLEETQEAIEENIPKEDKNTPKILKNTESTLKYLKEQEEKAKKREEKRKKEKKEEKDMMKEILKINEEVLEEIQEEDEMEEIIDILSEEILQEINN